MEKEYNNFTEKNENYSKSTINDLNNVAVEIKQAMLELNKKSPEELRKLYEHTLTKTRKKYPNKGSEK